MTRGSIREYAAALRPHYVRVSRAEKGRLLDMLCSVTGYHRKAAVRLLAGTSRGRGGERGRPARYDAAVRAALEHAWEATDRMCGKRLAPFLADLVSILERHGELTLSDATRTALLDLSAATIDRLLAPARQRHPRRLSQHRQASAALRALLPVRTAGEWADCLPGACQADLVLHCGETTSGFYLTTLLVVDVATGWTELEAIWGKGQDRVGSGMRRIGERLPAGLRELHTDNGSEFLNHQLYPWCQRHGVRLTRGRPYRKNDQAWVEQRNWQVVRRLVGYDRFSSHAAHRQTQRVYDLARLYVNFFQPISKLVGKVRVGARVRKRYDVAQIPHQRLAAAGVLSPTQQEGLARLYQRLNPIRLRAQLDAALDELWRLADPAASAATRPSGTALMRQRPRPR